MPWNFLRSVERWSCGVAQSCVVCELVRLGLRRSIEGSFGGGWWGSCAQASGLERKLVLGGGKNWKAHRRRTIEGSRCVEKEFAQCQMTFLLVHRLILQKLGYCSV